MKRKYLIVGSLAFVLFCKRLQGQEVRKKVDKNPIHIEYNKPEQDGNITENTIPKVNKTQIDVVYGHYMQDGNKSAITGGTGSEELMIYAPSISVKKYWENKALKVNLGADVISSVSTDKIDFVMSSASILDTRSFVNAVYEHKFNSKNLSLYGGANFSMESDYLSLGSKIGFVKEDAENMAQYSAEFQMFYDDLRWGRLNPDLKRPEKLIYPQELRYKEWHDTYIRESYNLKLGYHKVINPRAIIGIFPVLTYQTGLLSTPFHRIYFKNDTKAVENLPKNRYKASLGLKWNQFVGSRFVLKNTINPYIDNWGITAISIENETAIKLNAIWTLIPNARFYIQQGSRYFAGYKEHLPNEEFYTSDYDLSDSQTYNLGMGVKFSPFKEFIRNYYFNNLTLRYNYMHRNDGLSGHILTLSFQIEKQK